MLNRRQSIVRALLFSLCTLTGLAVSAPAARAAADTQAAAKFVQGLGDRAIAVLSRPGVTKQAERQEFSRLLEDNFDLQTIGRFVVGRYWNTASDAQRTEYMGLFHDMVVNVYSERFSTYAGQTFTVQGSRADGERDAIVSSQVAQPNGTVVNVEWRVRSKEQGLRIIDVVVENVSMSVTQRSEFSSVIESHGGDFGALISTLRERAANPTTAAK